MSLSEKKFRHEFKYYINYMEMIALQKKISAVLKIDPHSTSADGYPITSLYFDGVHNHALIDKNNGVFGREKYRIRIYNHSDNIIKLERKSKFGDFISKESATLSREEYDAILNWQYDILLPRTDSLVRDFYEALTKRYFQPTVIVDYVREAYVYEPGNVRVTFDKNLQAVINGIDLFDPTNVYQTILLPEQVILEVKFDQYLPDHIRQLLQPERFVRSAISKYVLCRERTIQYFK